MSQHDDVNYIQVQRTYFCRHLMGAACCKNCTGSGEYCANCGAGGNFCGPECHCKSDSFKPHAGEEPLIKAGA